MKGRTKTARLARLIKAFGPRCMACGSTKRQNLTIDHVVPFGHGGSNAYENLQILCKRCNNEKGSASCADYRPLARLARERNPVTPAPAPEGRCP